MHFRTDDLWLELDDEDLDCESPSSEHEPPRLHQSVDSYRPRKPAIALPPPPPRSAPPIGGAPPHSICGSTLEPFVSPTADTSSTTIALTTIISSTHQNSTITSPITTTTTTAQQSNQSAPNNSNQSNRSSAPAPIRSTTSTSSVGSTLPNGVCKQSETLSNDCCSNVNEQQRSSTFAPSNLRLEELELKRFSHVTAIHDADSPAGEMRLQQSLSTPCPSGSMEPSTSRKDSEYRRFKSEGSSAGACSLPAPEMDVTIDDLSPIADPRSSPPGRLNLFQDTVSNGPLTKHSHTEQVMMMHTLKTKLSKYQNFIDNAFQHIAQGSDEQIIEGCTIVAKVMTKAWMFPKISHDLSYALCDYLRDQNYLDALIMHFIKAQTCEPVRLASGRVLEECLSLNNREYVVNKGYLKKLVTTAMKLSKNPEQQRMSLSIMESLFKHSTATSYRLVEYGVLDHILLTCKRATETPITLRHAALALANLSLYSCSEAKKKIIQKKVPDWLFLLASQPDDLTRYYACLAICTLGSTKEMEAAVIKSGTLSLVEPFLLAHHATTFAGDHYKHSQGRPKEWLVRLLPMLKSKCREAKSMAAFHFTMEATIKKDQQKLEVFQRTTEII
ncbi:unnamed protein product [Anisakis simplex]|uniref:Ectoderm-expressed 4 (inferred by orthology to a D. melanogaster protein) n=1 Tax=Anisakis simplex TaxID=6269 RepID=A0A0M3JYK9_ANISI|nr:unnamed protein product [Anisakis simplex]